jgi:hypothetical protein
MQWTASDRESEREIIPIQKKQMKMNKQSPFHNNSQTETKKTEASD